MTDEAERQRVYAEKLMRWWAGQLGYGTPKAQHPDAPDDQQKGLGMHLTPCPCVGGTPCADTCPCVSPQYKSVCTRCAPGTQRKGLDG